jgi:hypothetical protein
MNNSSIRFFLILGLCLASLSAWAGGPLAVGGPSFGIDGQPFRWNPAAMPIRYRVDPGPMAVTSSGLVVVPNANGLQRVQSMFNVWQSVPTASLSFANAGTITPTGAYTGGDVQTLAQFDAINGSCNAAAQNPIIFDANGSLVAALGLPPEVIGFASPCTADPATGFIVSAFAVLNGEFQDGLDSAPNFELTPNEFDEALTHEFGHFSGLDHAQINLDLLTSFNGRACDLDSLSGLPLMFPIEFCQARKDAGLPVLAPDDVSWISKLYPASTQSTSYATISGAIFFSDGQSQFQGANVIARQVDDPNTAEDESRRVAVSVVSGYLFTTNPGQSVTGDNDSGDRTGSRKPGLVGFYEISVPPGTYTVEVESVFQGFQAGSSVGPINPPAFVPVSEFWKKDESAFDFPGQRDTITVRPGDHITDVNIILNSTNEQFDFNEDTGALVNSPVPFFAVTEGVGA